MLVSRRHNVAFAHYPKTAGTSLHRWFVETFPDATLVDPGIPHLSVEAGLHRLRPARWRRGAIHLRDRSLSLFVPGGADARRSFPHSLRIIGVLRDPLEMMASLFDYYRNSVYDAEPEDAFTRCAYKGDFRDFVSAAVIGGRLMPYDRFFDVGGPCWANTLLVDFYSLGSGLEAVCDELGVANRHPLPWLNRLPSARPALERYREEARPLLPEVHRHFRWYYEQGIHLTLGGGRQARRAA